MKRLNKNHGTLLTFLYHPKVPADNNASERAIRNAKVKMKVSNQLKTLAGTERFAVLRSVIDTTVKNSQNVLDALCLLSKISVTCCVVTSPEFKALMKKYFPEEYKE